MDEFEKIKTFSEGLDQRQQNIAKAQEQPEDHSDLNLPQYLSQFRAVPAQEEKESKRLLWIVLVLCGIIAAGTVIVLSCRVTGTDENEIVVISPTPVPVKILPENPGGLNIPDKDKVVYNRVNEIETTEHIENLFPEPEQPRLPNEVIEPENKEEITEVFEEIVPVKEQEMDVVASGNDLDVSLFEQEEAAVDTEKAMPEEVVVPKEEPKLEVKNEKVKEEQKKQQKKEKRIVWRAQLLSSSSKSKVESSWKQISQKQKALLSDMPYQIISATISGKGTFWRLQVGEFSTKEQVINLCEKLKKKKQECIPVK